MTLRSLRAHSHWAQLKVQSFLSPVTHWPSATLVQEQLDPTIVTDTRGTGLVCGLLSTVANNTANVHLRVSSVHWTNMNT